jgi:hypothetical protein
MLKTYLCRREETLKDAIGVDEKGKNPKKNSG